MTDATAVAIPNAIITSIERVEDASLYARYFEIRASIAYARGGNPNERYLWYAQAGRHARTHMIKRDMTVMQWE